VFKASLCACLDIGDEIGLGVRSVRDEGLQ
jgi:hypothetical protein